MLTLLATALLFLAIWIVVPAPHLWLLPLGIGAPEVSPLLLGASVIVLALALRRFRTRRIAVLFALVAAGVAAIPLSKLAATERAFDRALTAVLPSAMRTEGPSFGRKRPFVLSDMVFGMTSGDVRTVRSLQFTTGSGQPLVLDVYRPAADGPFPVIVQIHGGAWQRGGRGDNETFARYLAGRGYVVIAIEYRHAPRWLWPAAMEDVRAAMVWVRANARSFQGDPARIALVGRSAGAHLALLAAYTAQGPIRSVVSFYGPTDLAQGWEIVPKPDPLSVRSVLETFLGGAPAAMPATYRDASPITYVSGASPPTLLVYGRNDHVVLPSFGRALHERLQMFGASSVYLEIPWAEHAFDELPSGLSGQVALYYTERFLAATLR